jgi:hypothetical protein
MSSFTSNILLEQLGATDNCEVKRDMIFYSYLYNLEITIKQGFVTDLASIPPLLKSVVRGSANKFWRAFVIHDALYRMGYDRKKADRILDEALQALGMGAYTRGKIYYGLRMFGSVTANEELIKNAIKYVIIDGFN